MKKFTAIGALLIVLAFVTTMHAQESTIQQTQVQPLETLAQPVISGERLTTYGEAVWMVKERAVYFSADQGKTFTTVPLSQKVQDLICLGEGTLILLTRDGKLLSTKDNAMTFEEYNLPKAKYRFVAVSPSGKNIVLTTPDHVVSSTDSGLTWQTYTIPVLGVKQVISGFAENEFMLLSSAGAWKSEDTGLTWRFQDSFPLNVTSLALSKKANKLFALQDAKVLSSDNGGLDWQTLDYELADGKFIHFDEYGNRLVVSTSTGLVAKRLEEPSVEIAASSVPSRCVPTRIYSMTLYRGYLFSSGDCMRNGKPYVNCGFDGLAGKLVSVRIPASSFPMVLRLYQNEVLVTQVTGGDMGGRPWLEYRLPVNGPCRLEIASQTTQTGSFSLYFQHPTNAIAIQGGSSVSNLLDTQSYASVEKGIGYGAVRYVFSIEAGKLIDALITRADFDTTMIVFGPDGRRVAIDEDAGIGSNSWISTRAPTTGIYTIEVTSRAPFATGNFSLRLWRAGSAEFPAVGQNLVRDLNDFSPASVALGAGFFANRYVYTLNAGQTVEFQVRSTDINIRLYLFNAQTQVIATASAPSYGANAILRYRPSVTTQVTLEVTSGNITDQGTFFLTSVRVPN